MLYGLIERLLYPEYAKAKKDGALKECSLCYPMGGPISLKSFCACGECSESEVTNAAD